MWRNWRGLVVIAAVLAAVTGCRKTDYLQPPRPKEEFTQPPADDPRFSNPPNYPAKLLNQDNMRKNDDGDDGSGKGPRLGGGMHGN